MTPFTWLYLIQPYVITLGAFALLYVYYRKHLLTTALLLISALAYFLAIAAKVIFQAIFLEPSDLVLAGLYFGLQAVIFEVGLAYMFALYATFKHRLRAEQAPAFGAGLAFWENGVLFGLLLIPDLLAQIITGMSGLPSGSVGQVLQPVAIGLIERISSILAHFSWGILTAIAAASGKRRYLAAALPMGLIDFLVPFASSYNMWIFEAVILVLSVLSLAVTYLLTKKDWPMIWDLGLPATPNPESGHADK